MVSENNEIRTQRIAMLSEMLEADPNDGFALYGLAMEAKVSGELEQASTLLERLLVVDPKHLYGGYQLGEIRLSLGENVEARKVLETSRQKALELGDAKAARELSELLDMCG